MYVFHNTNSIPTSNKTMCTANMNTLTIRNNYTKESEVTNYTIKTIGLRGVDLI